MKKLHKSLDQSLCKMFLALFMIFSPSYGQFNTATTPAPFNFPPVGFDDTRDDAFLCIAPNLQEAACISVYSCPALLGIFLNPPQNKESEKFLEKSYCLNGFGRYPYVCCTDETSFNPEVSTPKPINPEIEDGNQLASKLECADSYFHYAIGGTPTNITEYPWMVLIEYDSDKPNSTNAVECAGSIINKRYILTAAHCVTGEILEKVGEPFRVRLGEYDIEKEEDCIDGICSDPIIQINISEIIPHEYYNEKNPSRHHDIALLRLSESIEYSMNIRPICIPSAINFKGSETNTKVFVAGWGRTLLARQSNVKMKVEVPIFDHENCTEKFHKKKIEILETQLCAGGNFKEDTCSGDSGGPLMRKVDKFWIIEGIVSFGRGCGLEGWPGVYTRVSEYEDWIQDNIKP